MYTIDRGVQPAFAYNPYLDFLEKFFGKKYLDILNASTKSDFNVLWKSLE